MPEEEKDVFEKTGDWLIEEVWDPFGVRPDYDAKPNEFVDPGDQTAETRPMPTMEELDVPPVRRGDGANGEVTVDTNALLYFADVIDTILPNIEKALTDIQKVDVRPGNFMHGDAIVQKVEGNGEKGGLKVQYTDSLTKMRDACSVFSTRCKEIGNKYDTADELNNEGADALSSMLTEVGSYLPNVPGTGPANENPANEKQPPTEAPPPPDQPK